MNIEKAISEFYLKMTINELRLMSDRAKYFNITYNSFLYLQIIDSTENATISYIANALHVAKSAVTLKVNELMKQNLVIKTQSEKDKRIFYLSVNDKVREEYKIYNSVLRRAVSRVQKDVTKENAKMFCEILNQIGSGFAKEIEAEYEKK